MYIIYRYDVYFPGLPPRFRVLAADLRYVCERRSLLAMYLVSFDTYADLRLDPDASDSDADEDMGQEFDAAR